MLDGIDQQKVEQSKRFKDEVYVNTLLRLFLFIVETFVDEQESARNILNDLGEKLFFTKVAVVMEYTDNPHI